ncbi:MAG TPA: hypothetical protein VIP82_20795 [Microbacterium sp.]|uniref:hypothetical protein n=1 Tax=Microbacterium sp. TaxID=51671 RepID=UPI002F927C37
MSRSREKQREYMRAYRARKKAETKESQAASKPEVPSSSATGAPDATPTPGRHAAAVDRMLQESGLSRLDEEGPLVELLKDLAAELDAGAEPRTRQQYLTALRDARRVLAAAPGSAGVGGSDPDEKDPPVAEEPEVPAAPAVDPEVADFASFKRAKGGAAAR